MTWQPVTFVSEDGFEVMVNIDPARIIVALRGPGATVWGPPLKETTRFRKNPDQPPLSDELAQDERESAVVYFSSDPCPLCGSMLGLPWGDLPRRCPGCGADIRQAAS